MELTMQTHDSNMTTIHRAKEYMLSLVNMLNFKTEAEWVRSEEKIEALSRQVDLNKISDGVRMEKGRYIILCDGMEKTLKEWSAYTGLKRSTLYYRLKAGWALEDVLFRPLRSSNRH